MNPTTRLTLTSLFRPLVSQFSAYDVEIDERWAAMLSQRYGIEVTPEDIAYVRGLTVEAIKLRERRKKKRQGVSK